MLSPFSKSSGDQHEKDKSSTSNLFSVDILGGKGAKAKEAAAQSDQEVSRLRKELIERDQRVNDLVAFFSNLWAVDSCLFFSFQLFVLFLAD